eukprot:TRINITY_DN1085_c0_g1_i2.p1 TRINITY_DN1085_c0_g1~~TRINITY_DN1085_c0_g1_i2.p1  ORF type:complete len:214 (-),score=56.58 TRINITY_DN1085_c0_g1_i2:325-966(-)
MWLGACILRPERLLLVHSHIMHYSSSASTSRDDKSEMETTHDYKTVTTVIADNGVPEQVTVFPGETPAEAKRRSRSPWQWFKKKARHQVKKLAVVALALSYVALALGKVFMGWVISITAGLNFFIALLVRGAALYGFGACAASVIGGVLMGMLSPLEMVKEQFTHIAHKIAFRMLKGVWGVCGGAWRLLRGRGKQQDKGTAARRDAAVDKRQL